MDAANHVVNVSPKGMSLEAVLCVDNSWSSLRAVCMTCIILSLLLQPRLPSAVAEGRGETHTKIVRLFASIVGVVLLER